jgi:hypothetical protein
VVAPSFLAATVPLFFEVMTESELRVYLRLESGDFDRALREQMALVKRFQADAAKMPESWSSMGGLSGKSQDFIKQSSGIKGLMEEIGKANPAIGGLMEKLGGLASKLSGWGMLLALWAIWCVLYMAIAGRDRLRSAPVQAAARVKGLENFASLRIFGIARAAYCVSCRWWRTRRQARNAYFIGGFPASLSLAFKASLFFLSVAGWTK